jgi:predicted Rossmann fold nucleotide-binding protein DprA/Smf involved in DNA uptake
MDPSDLNHLATLDALLQEVSVTRAARRLGLSTPAVSHALARLELPGRHPRRQRLCGPGAARAEIHDPARLR